MAQGITIEVLDREGWRKEVSLQKGIIHIGSDPRNDVLLEPARGAGVDLLHAQLIAVTNGSGFQLVNLGDRDIWLGPSSDQVLAPRTAVPIADGAVFKVGEFSLIFHAGSGASGGFAGAAPHIGLSVSLPQHRLLPNRSLEGVIRVTNRGDRTGAQFNLDLEGLDADCYEIEPGPILSSGAEKEVSFRLYHRGNKPLAGEVTLAIRASAPQAYPAEEASVTQTVQVLPSYRHQLRLVCPTSVKAQRREEPAALQAQPAPPVQEEAPPIPPPAPAPARERSSKAETSAAAEDWWTAPAGTRPARHPPPPAAPPAEPAAASAPEPPPAEGSRSLDGVSPQPAAEGTGSLEASPGPPAGEPVPELPAREGERGPEASPGLATGEAVSGLPAAGTPQPVPEPAAPSEGGQLPPPSPAGQSESVPTGPAAGLPAAVDWWSVTEPEVPQEPLRPPARPGARPGRHEPPAHLPGAPAAAEDWWTPPVEPAEVEVKDEPGVLKLKASLPAETESTPAPTPPPSGDWWASQSEAGREALPEKPRVLKLKARPATEPQPASAAPATPAAARAEDWWTPQPAPGSDQPPDAPSVTEDS